MKKNVKIFISGKVSGMGYNWACLYFQRAETYLHNSLGVEIVNPTKLCNSNWRWLHCMVVCLWNLYKCDAIAMIPNWKYSCGAKIEFHFARLLGKDVIFLGEEIIEWRWKDWATM